MTAMWMALLPLIVASAVLPIELIVTLMLVGTPGRARTAAAGVAGMVVVRVLQGVVFGMVLHWGSREKSGGDHRWIVSTVLLIVALLFLIMAVRELLGGDDADAPPPKWIAAIASMTPGRAFLLGMAGILISVKLWVFTFAAIGVIGDADLTRAQNVVVYLVFVLLCVSTHLVIVGAAAFFPLRSHALLDGALRWLQAHNRVIMIALGLVFGTWFLVKALVGFGIL